MSHMFLICSEEEGGEGGEGGEEEVPKETDDVMSVPDID
jgi:hypothetical protein